MEDNKENSSHSRSSVTVHVRHKRNFNLSTLVLPPGSTVRDLKLDVSSKRLWEDIKTKDDIRKIVRPGERVPLWERYVFTDKDDGACFIIVPKPDPATVARKEAERQARIATLTPEVLSEINDLSHLVKRLEQQLSELEDMEIDLIVASRVKRCALERDSDVSMKLDDNTKDMDDLCDFMDSAEQRARDTEQMRRVEAEAMEDQKLLEFEEDTGYERSEAKRSKHDDMNID